MAAILCRGAAIRSAAQTFATRCSFARAFSRGTSRERNFEHAIALLDTLQSNKQVVQSLSDSGHDANALAIPEMLSWLRKAGYSPGDFTDRLKFIQVAGTKGKGSVCAMVESVLLQYRVTGGGSRKGGLGGIGLYTSPHLLTVRERIRLDGTPISERMFTQYFFDLWDRFCPPCPIEAVALNISKPLDADHEPKPNYFRFLTILALHTFMQEGIETAIMECGIGGEYDSTNILPPDAVTATGITSLGIDHVGLLGESIEEIAWHKAGIMKRGVPAFTVRQPADAQAVLERRASEKGAELAVVELSSVEGIKLGLEGDFQKENAALAVAIAACHLGKLDLDVPLPRHMANTLPRNFVNGLMTVSWPGRCQVLQDGNITWFLDGAHTAESIRAAALWFHRRLRQAQREAEPPTATMLIFNQEDRDGAALLRHLMTALYTVHSVGVIYPQTSTFGRPAQRLGRSLFTYAAFPTNTPFMRSGNEKSSSIKAQQRLAYLYQSMDGNSLHMSYTSIEEAVALAKRVSEGDDRVFVFVTGSLYLAGGVLQVLEHMKATR